MDPATALLIQTVSTVIQTVAVGFGIYFGYQGLSSWKREMIGRRKAELAEDILAHFYQARDEIVAIRSPASYGAEAVDRPREETEDDQTARKRDAYYVPIARIKRNAEFWGKLYALRYRYMAVFGKVNAKPFDDIHQVLGEIQVAASMLIADTRRKRYRPVDANTAASIEKDEAAIWAHPRQEDEISRKVDGAIDTVEATCAAFITAAASR